MVLALTHNHSAYGAQGWGALRELRTWRRHHVDGSVSEVTSIPGIGYWEACVSYGEPPRKQQVGEHFALLTSAQERADSLTQTLSAHDCALCGPWDQVDRRKADRGKNR
jgi:hypothetical protein